MISKNYIYLISDQDPPKLAKFRLRSDQDQILINLRSDEHPSVLFIWFNSLLSWYIWCSVSIYNIVYHCISVYNIHFVTLDKILPINIYSPILFQCKLISNKINKIQTYASLQYQTKILLVMFVVPFVCIKIVYSLLQYQTKILLVIFEIQNQMKILLVMFEVEYQTNILFRYNIK